MSSPFVKTFMCSIYEQEYVPDKFVLNNPFDGKTTEQLFNEQKTWLNMYIKSPKYKENILKEISLSKGRIRPLDAERKANSIISSRLKNLNNVSLVVKDKWGRAYAQTNTITNKHQIIIPKAFADSRFWFYVGSKNEQNISNIEKFLKAEYWYLTPIHELTHISTEGNSGLVRGSKKILKQSSLSSKRYYKSPTEIHARITSVKYLAHALGYYDAYTQDFTTEILSKLKANPWVRSEHNLKNLLEDIYPGQEETIIEMSNLMADVANPLEDSALSSQT